MKAVQRGKRWVVGGLVGGVVQWLADGLGGWARAAWITRGTLLRRNMKGKQREICVA